MSNIVTLTKLITVLLLLPSGLQVALIELITVLFYTAFRSTIVALTELIRVLLYTAFCTTIVALTKLITVLLLLPSGVLVSLT